MVGFGKGNCAEELMLLREYFRRTGDNKSSVWVLSPVRPSDFLQHHIDIGLGKERYRIIDQFGGRQPILLNYDFMINDANVIKFVLTILLDSNVMSYLHKYVTGDISFRLSRRGLATKNLLTQFVILGCDYSPIFYLLETLTKNVFEKTFPHAREFAETILRLHTMDEAYFLKSGDIRPDKEQVAAYLEDNNVKTLSKLAELRVRHIATGLTTYAPVNLQATYACLLKAGILNCAKVSQQRKMEQFFEFLHNELGCLMAREALVAGLHFRSKAGNLIPINPNYKKDFKVMMMASSWDILLLRMPEFLLAQGDQRETILAYVCTADRALQELGAMFTLFRLENTMRNNFTPIPQMIFHEDIIKRLLGPEISSVFFRGYDHKRVIEQVRVPVDQNALAKIISNLEYEASSIMGLKICK